MTSLVKPRFPTGSSDAGNAPIVPDQDIPHESRQPEVQPCILAVDDSRVMLASLIQKLEAQGHNVLTAKDGGQALEVLRKEHHRIEAVLLDRMMPNIDGMGVLQEMKEDAVLAKIPVIMQTGADSPEQIKEGIDAGAFYYLTKPVQDDLLFSVLTAALSEHRQRQALKRDMDKQNTNFGLIEHCSFKLKSLAEAESLATFIAHCFPEPEQAVNGLAELLINAVEHGNLGISYEEKTRLIAENRWRQEVEHRLTLPEYRDKYVDVMFRKTDDDLSIKIKDQGKGFNWRKYLQIDPARAMDNHGRGIAMANAQAFSKVKYNDVGNSVTAYADLKAEDLDW